MNTLFPIFVKIDQVPILLIGGGPVALEKFTALIRNNPAVKLTVVAKEIHAEFRDILAKYPHIEVFERPFEENDLRGKRLLMTATNDPFFNVALESLAKKYTVLINAADKPALCDFYLGSIVQKGDLKIAISTNGKSPTIAKRVKELFQDLLPEEIDETLTLMESLRHQLKGDFEEKVKQLNAHTKILISK